ncbi:MAG: Uma2 family endonuclease [Magnetococcales bacterium]|nr:Uma2 family endonuclease [Nitrospirota bacterium]
MEKTLIHSGEDQLATRWTTQTPWAEEERLNALCGDFDLTEIIDGQEVVVYSPSFEHQIVLIKIAAKIIIHLQYNKIGEMLLSPLDVILEEGRQRLQPDLIFIRNERMFIAQDWIRGAPDMVCEVVSPGSYRYDAIKKRKIYEDYGVAEFWLVQPQHKAIEVFAIANGRYVQRCAAAEEGVITSEVIDGLEFDVRDIFGAKE